MANGQTTRVSQGGIKLSLTSAQQTALSSQGIRAAVTELLGTIDDRSRRILSRRFGIENGVQKTLHAIGVEEGVTRERIRQIEHLALKTFHGNVSQGAAVAVSAVARKQLGDFLRSLGGIAREETLHELLLLNSETDRAAFRLLIKTLPDVTDVRETATLVAHYRQADSIPLDRVLESARALFKEAGTLLADAAFLAKLRQRTNSEAGEGAFRSALSIARDIVRTPYGEWGLHIWAEAAPRGVGDKAFIVLKRSTKPLHFSAITEAINATHFDRRTAHAQTVHNELIRDDRFVLVGRGLYGLKEWGYQPGTVADVLMRILRSTGTPLARDQLVADVLKERLVKRNTVLLALQNRTQFNRLSDGRYALANGGAAKEHIQHTQGETTPPVASPSMRPSVNLSPEDTHRGGDK